MLDRDIFKLRVSVDDIFYISPVGCHVYWLLKLCSIAGTWDFRFSTLMFSKDPVNLESFTYLLSRRSWILNTWFVVGCCEYWVANIYFLVCSWEYRIWNFDFIIGSCGSWILNRNYVVGSCGSWIWNFDLVFRSCGSWILNFYFVVRSCGSLISFSPRLMSDVLT